MAEIRKHNPEAGNLIAQALRAAIGEPVRPHEPGAARTSAQPTNLTIGTANTAIVNLSVTTTEVVVSDEDD